MITIIKKAFEVLFDFKDFFLRSITTTMTIFRQKMHEINIKKIGGAYTMQREHHLPTPKLPSEKEQPIGVWEQRHLRYLKQHHKVMYYNLLTPGKLRSHLADTEEQAQQLFLRLVNEYNEGSTE